MDYAKQITFVFVTAIALAVGLSGAFKSASGSAESAVKNAQSMSRYEAALGVKLQEL